MSRSYPQVTFHTHTLGKVCAPGLIHSRFDIQNFHYANRIDLYTLFEAQTTPHRALFVDVGFYEFCGTSALDYALCTYGVSWNNARAFITHFHEDHDGNLTYCVKKGLSEINHGPLIFYSDQRRDLFLLRTGLKQTEGACVYPGTEFIMGKNHFSPEVRERMRMLANHDHIVMGDYNLEVLYTPGHAPEHACLLDRSKHILFAGDHILDAAPGHMQLYPNAHTLKHFLDNLQTLKTLNLEHIYMSHTDALQGTQTINSFIDRIIESYEVQLYRMQELLRDLSITHTEVSAYEVAVAHYAHHPGGLKAQSDFMRMRRTAIIYAYLDYLVDTGFLISRIREDGACAYRCA